MENEVAISHYVLLSHDAGEDVWYWEGDHSTQESARKAADREKKDCKWRIDQVMQATIVEFETKNGNGSNGHKDEKTGGK